MSNSISTRIAGHLVRATLVGDMWEAQIDPDTPLMERPFDLRSTYASTDAFTALRVAAVAAAEYEWM